MHATIAPEAAATATAAASAAAAARALRREDPPDQASGLRRLFAATRRRQLLPVVANPFVPAEQAVLEMLSAALVAQGHRVLVVDAAGTAPRPHEMAVIDLAAGVEALHPQVAYLAARGLPLRYVDARGSAGAFVDAAFDAAPSCDVVLLHADPTDLARMLGARAARPLLLAADDPEALKQAYAGCKLLVQRSALMTFDLLLAASPFERRAALIVERLASCADTFLGAVLQAAVTVDALRDPQAAQDPALARLLQAQLAAADSARPSAPLRSARPDLPPASRATALREPAFAF